MAKRKTSCGNARMCSMLLTNVTRSASYEALPNHRLFPARSGLTSRLRHRCLWHLRSNKSGDAVGRPSCRSSLLGDPGAKFLVETGDPNRTVKNSLNYVSTCLRVVDTRRTFPSSLMSASLRLLWIIVIILFVALDASPYARDTSISGFPLGDSMGHSKAEKSKTHKRIVAIASKRFREEGLAGIGIAELMKEAGLTVGGFYKHFDSRDDLVAEAVGSALGAWKRQVDAAASGGPPVTYESLVDEYLDEAHRNHPGMGCPIGALAGDLARSDKRTRALVSRKIRDNIELLATLIRNRNETDEGSARSQAVLTYCALVGAIGMARAVSDEALFRVTSTAT